MKKKFLLFACTILSSLMISGCSSDEPPVDNSAVVGTWFHTEAEYDATYNFHPDSTYSKTLLSKGSYSATMQSSGSYECRGNKITLDTGAEYEYTIEDDTMTWTTGSGKDIIYKKK